MPMAKPLEDIEKALLALPERSRADLAAKLIHSLDGEADADAERLWLEEVRRRAEAVREGQAELYSVAEVMDALRGKYTL
jgi:hypothetical protein